jgi:EAL domain-containing protein (putative c-di-GMP-specific phosphodiesterase class I)
LRKAYHSLMNGPQLIQPKCSACKDGVSQPFPITMAFQPIVDVVESRVFAYEALVRGVKNEPAGLVMAQLTTENRYAFDQSCRVAAITLAARLGLHHTGARLSINFMPGAVYSPAACIRLTLETARAANFPLDLLIFEITEMEEVKDRDHVLNIAKEYRRHGFQMAIDDFGAGYSGLNLLADLNPEIVKLDMDLTRNLHNRPTAMTIVRSTVELCKELGMTCVAEGVETVEELRALRSCGIRFMQGYLLARPAFEALPPFTLPESCDLDPTYSHAQLPLTLLA